MKLKWLLALLLLVMASEAFSQTYMIVRKKGSTRKYQYFVGSEIVYKQKGREVFFTDRITEFADSTIVMENNILLISQLEELDVRNTESNRAPYLRVSEGLLPTVGIGLLAIDLFNNSVIDGNEFSLDRSTTATAVSLTAIGYGLKLARRKKVNLNKPKFEAYIVGL